VEVMTKADILARAGQIMDRPLVNTNNAWSANASDKYYGPWSGFKVRLGWRMVGEVCHGTPAVCA
jgi:hypothetical protein